MNATASTPTPAPRMLLALLALVFVLTTAATLTTWIAVESAPGGLAAPLQSTGLPRAEQLQRVTLVCLACALPAMVAVLAYCVHRAAPLTQWVTICAWTRRVQWQGRWMSFEDFLTQRFQVRCTHGICEEAAAEMRRRG